MMRIITIIFLMSMSFSALCEVPDLEPIQLLDFGITNNGTVTVMKGSLESLFLNENVSNRNVVIISIAGAFRKGKSFLLNYMLRYMYAHYDSILYPLNEEIGSNVMNSTNKANDWMGSSDDPLKGFAWKSSTKRETTGIIFWPDIFLYDDPNGDKIAIYLMDTQGLFDHNSSPTDNIRIFSLSALMSSVQMMNIFSMIEESHLEYLQFATEYARFSAVDSDSGFKPFQKLMFLIRDWISPDEYDYGLKGGNAFIKSFLQIREFHTKELKAVRQYLSATFDSISCFLMPYPGKIVARNSSYDGRWSAIDEEFIDALRELFPVILSPANLTLKTINGNPVKALELSVFIKQYVELFKSENLPEAKSIYESTLDNQFQILVSKAVEVYLQVIQMKQSNITNYDEVGQLHHMSKTLSLKYFDEEKKFGNSQEGLTYRNELENKLENAFVEWAPITLEHLKTIKVEQKKTDEQVVLTNKAQDRDTQAKKEVEIANKKLENLKRLIEQSRSDTEDSRREAENLKLKLIEANKGRQAALQKESQTRQYFEEMLQKVKIYEAQLARHKFQATQKVNERVAVIQKKHGMLQFFEDAFIGITKFVVETFQSTIAFVG